MFQGISPQNMAQNMVLTYLQFRIQEISHWFGESKKPSPRRMPLRAALSKGEGPEGHVAKWSQTCDDLNILNQQLVRKTRPGKHTKNDGKSPCIVDFPMKMVIFHSYVSLPEGNQHADSFFFHPHGWIIGKRVPLALPKIGIQASKIGI